MEKSKNPRKVLILRKMYHMSSKTQSAPNTLREQLKYCPVVLNN
jgi:hypothetical protein